MERIRTGSMTQKQWGNHALKSTRDSPESLANHRVRGRFRAKALLQAGERNKKNGGYAGRSAALQFAWDGARYQFSTNTWSSSMTASIFFRSLRRALSALTSKVRQSVKMSRRSRIRAAGMFWS